MVVEEAVVFKEDRGGAEEVSCGEFGGGGDRRNNTHSHSWHTCLIVAS